MQINCTGCSKPINIPDEKLPKDKAVTVTCPECKAKVRVDQHLRSSSGETASASQKAESDDVLSIVSSGDEEEDEFKIYGENDQIALILDDVRKAQWAKELAELNYKIEYAKSPEQAVHKMKFTQFHLVVLSDNYCGVSLDDSVVYQSLKEMPMSIRRKIFLALVGKQFKSANNMQAFQYSANVVINEKDMDKASLILKKSCSENEAFYKVFKETLHSLGKV